MNSEIGLWIDHRKAVIVTLTGLDDATNEVASNMPEDHASPGSGSESPEDQRDRRFTEHLNQYYDRVIARIRDAGSILIMGPDEAKGELKERLAREVQHQRIVCVEAADKMTDRQVRARVRFHYGKSKRRLPNKSAGSGRGVEGD